MEPSYPLSNDLLRLQYLENFIMTFLKIIFQNNYGVVVLNTNRNTATVDGKEESLTIRVSDLYHSPYLFVCCQASPLGSLAS